MDLTAYENYFKKVNNKLKKYEKLGSPEDIAEKLGVKLEETEADIDEAKKDVEDKKIEEKKEENPYKTSAARLMKSMGA